MTEQLIMITGAAGFVGKHTVEAARSRGHKVCAVVRRAKSIPQSWRDDDGITAVICDLGVDPAGIGLALKNVDTVIHIAASLAGDDAAQMQDTIAATKTVLAGISEQSGPVHLVLASSMSVYDTMSVNAGGTVDEHTKTEPNPAKRDAYCRAKLAQEAMCRDAVPDLSILRIGAVFGKGRVWNSHLGIAVGPLLLRLGGRGQLPLCYVKHCAKALVWAAEKPVVLVNVVDDDLPDRTEFINALKKNGWPKFVISLPWKVLDVLASIIGLLPITPPGLLRKPVLHARMKPLKYSNKKLREQLGWTADYSFEQAMQEAGK